MARVEPTARAALWTRAHGRPVPPEVDVDRVLERIFTEAAGINGVP